MNRDAARNSSNRSPFRRPSRGGRTPDPRWRRYRLRRARTGIRESTGALSKVRTPSASPVSAFRQRGAARVVEVQRERVGRHDAVERGDDVDDLVGRPTPIVSATPELIGARVRAGGTESHDRIDRNRSRKRTAERPSTPRPAPKAVLFGAPDHAPDHLQRVVDRHPDVRLRKRFGRRGENADRVHAGRRSARSKPRSLGQSAM